MQHGTYYCETCKGDFKAYNDDYHCDRCGNPVKYSAEEAKPSQPRSRPYKRRKDKLEK